MPSPQCHSFIKHMCRLYKTSGSYVCLNHVQQLLPFLSRVLQLVVLILHQLVVISYFRQEYYVEQPKQPESEPPYPSPATEQVTTLPKSFLPTGPTFVPKYFVIIYERD